MSATAVSLPRLAEAFPALVHIPFRSLADSVFERTVPAREGGTLELDLDTGGDIEIIGTDDQKVSVHGTLGGRDWQETTVALKDRNGDATLVTRYTGSSSEQTFDNRFSIRVPKKFNVRLQSAGGGVHITNVDGSFSGETGGGKIAIEGAKGEAHLSTGGGDVRVTKSNLDGSVSTGGGTVRFEGVTGDIVGSSGTDPFHGAAPGAYYYKMKMPRGSSYSWTPGMDAETFKQTQKALEASQDAMRRAQEIMSDSTMRKTNREMARARIMMDRERATMDSMRIRMGRHRWWSDSSSDDSGDVGDDTTVHERHKEIIRYRTPDEHRSSTISRDGFIVIDKDGGSVELQDAPKGARVTTGAGAIVISKSKGDVRAETGGGDIDLGSLDGGADATTGAGDVSCTEKDCAPVVCPSATPAVGSACSGGSSKDFCNYPGIAPAAAVSAPAGSGRNRERILAFPRVRNPRARAVVRLSWPVRTPTQTTTGRRWPTPSRASWSSRS